MKISNPRGPNPQRGFSWVGAEQTSKLRPENLNGQKSWDELTDARVSLLYFTVYCSGVTDWLLVGAL